MPSSPAFCTAGATAEESCAKTISALAPCAIRLSMSVNCFCGEDCASAEMYLSPAAAIAAFIAASSVFQRSSWKFDQETPITLPLACARPATQTDSAAPASMAAANFLIVTLPVTGRCSRAAGVRLFSIATAFRFASVCILARSPRRRGEGAGSGGFAASLSISEAPLQGRKRHKPTRLAILRVPTRRVADMTRLAAFRFVAFVALALGLAACGVISTLVEGWKYAKAVEADLESATGVKPSVGFKWENGRLLTVTVAYPQLYEKKPLAALAEIVRRSVETHFKQKPEDIELSFSLGRSGSGTVAELEGNTGLMASSE